MMNDLRKASQSRRTDQGNSEKRRNGSTHPSIQSPAGSGTGRRGVGCRPYGGSGRWRAIPARCSRRRALQMPPPAGAERQSHRTEQGHPELGKLYQETDEIGYKSQSHSTDQGNPDNHIRRPQQAPAHEVAIPPYCSGPFRLQPVQVSDSQAVRGACFSNIVLSRPGRRPPSARLRLPGRGQFRRMERIYGPPYRSPVAIPPY
jgi:hypothetical protein